MALRYLMQMQSRDGVFGTRATTSFIYNHALATLALCEAYALTRNPRYKEPAQRGLDYIARHRNPYLAWRYSPRGGDNDTSVTAMCVTALAAGKRAGLEADPDAFRGALAWVDKMTDPNFGNVGYNFPGGLSARQEGLQHRFPPEKTQAMTAAGIWIRLLCGQNPREHPVMRKGIELCLETPPSWNPEDGSIDMYYWLFGTLAMYRVGGRAWARWSRFLESAVLAGQRRKGAADGSWDPVGAWGGPGGRVYATAVMALTLEVLDRYANHLAR